MDTLLPKSQSVIILNLTWTERTPPCDSGEGLISSLLCNEWAFNDSRFGLTNVSGDRLWISGLKTVYPTSDSGLVTRH